MGKNKKNPKPLSKMPAGLLNLSKPAMIGITAVCLVLAGVITFMTISDGEDVGIPDEFAKQMVWFTCRNPACGVNYQLSKKEYFEQIEELQAGERRRAGTPPLICKECGEPSVHEAVKCAKCGLIFEIGLIGLKRGDYADRCPNPKCGYSQIEEDRKKAAAARGEGGAKGTPPE